ncbi:MAG: glycosyltransferase family 2 protein [Patescibacteria group bacterium]
MDLSIIIVSHNGNELARDCLKSIFGNTHKISFEVFVVDNASVDGTPEMVRAEFPQVKLIQNKENSGFAKANNQAIKLAQGEFILLLNQDTRVLPEALSNMVGFMRAHPEAGGAGCRLINEKGETVQHVRRFPGIWEQAAIILKLPHFFSRLLDKYLMADFDYSKSEPQEVDSVRGSFFMIRREVLEKLGGLDERYFFWFEEVDYCRSAKAAGYKVMYNGAAECIDLVGQSVKKLGQYKKQRMFLESMVKYFRKWHPGWRAWLIEILRPIGLGLSWLADKIKK